MFEKITSWFKGAWQKVFKKETLQKSIGAKVAISQEMATALDLWVSIYKNKAPWLNSEIKSLRLGSTIAAEFARLTTIEMVLETKGSDRADYINEQLKPFKDRLREKLEFGLAYGGIAIKPYPSNGKILLDFVTADQFYPTRFDSNGKVTAAAFITQIVKDKTTYTKVEYHDFDGMKETVTNSAFRQTENSEPYEIPLTQVEEWANIVKKAQFNNVSMPLFAYFKTPLANEADPDSPLGVSIYSRAVDLLEQADKQWERIEWENESAKRTLTVDDTALKYDEFGNREIPNRRLYTTLNTNDPDLFKEWSPQIRIEEMSKTFDSILKRIEFTVGLAYGTISDPQTVAATATEIKTSKQRSFSTISDIQKAAGNTIDHVIYIIDVYATIFKFAPKGDVKTKLEWYDSILTDRDAELERKLKLEARGILSKAEIRAWETGEDLEQALANLPKDEGLDFGGN